MCEGFGAVYYKTGKAFFTAPDKGGDIRHTAILAAVGRRDNKDQFNRTFVRIECPDWTINSFRFDEENTLPGWAEEAREDIMLWVEKTLSICAPAYAEYDRARDAACAEYNRVCSTAYVKFAANLEHVPCYIA